jgi:hypothetical protein
MLGGTMAVDSGATDEKSLRLVVSASAAGTAFEWYDFFIFVPLSSHSARLRPGLPSGRSAR